MKSNRCNRAFIDEMRLFGKSIDGELFSFSMKNHDLIRDIKMKMYDKTGLNVEEQILCYQGEILEDMRELNYYEIINYSIIDVVGRLRGGMQIFVKVMNEIFEIEVDNGDKIRKLKLKIKEKAKILVSKQNLVYQGLILENNKTIDEYQIYDQTVINVVYNLGRDKIKIFVKISDENTFEIEFEKSGKIFDLRYTIEEELGLCADKHKLVFRGEILNDDDKSIDEYQICDQSVIDILAKIRITIASNGVNKTIEMFETDKVKDLKYQIEEKLALNLNEKKLVFEGKILDDDDKSINEYQICNQSVIDILAKIVLCVTTSGGQFTLIDIYKTDKIKDLKHHIQEKLALNLDEQKSIFQGEILDDDDKTIDEYQICDQSMIYIEAKITLLVKTGDGIIKSMGVYKAVYINELKRQIREYLEINLDGKILVFQDKILEDDDKTIDEYQICDQSVIEIDNEYGIGLFIKTIDGNTITCQIKKSDNVIEVKKKIQEKIGLHWYEQILIFKGAILENSKRIDHYEIRDKSVITIVARLRYDEIQINCKKDNGKTVSILAKKSEKLIDLKRKIHRKISIHHNSQILFYQDEKLDDDDEKIIDEYQLYDQCEIKVISKDKSHSDMVMH